MLKLYFGKQLIILLKKIYVKNCSFIILSSRLWFESWRMVSFFVLSVDISIYLISLASTLSAVALTGLVSKLSTSILIFTLWGSNAPLHLLGLNELIGVKANMLAFNGIIGPLADKL